MLTWLKITSSKKKKSGTFIKHWEITCATVKAMNSFASTCLDGYHTALKVSENQTVHTYNATWPGQSTTSQGHFHTDADEAVCNQLKEADPSATADLIFNLSRQEAEEKLLLFQFGKFWYGESILVYQVKSFPKRYCIEVNGSFYNKCWIIMKRLDM